MPDHPIDAILATGVTVQKALLKLELKKYARDFVDATTFRTYDLPNVTIAVIGGQLYLFDPLDLATADNGTTCIHDASARRFKRQSAAVAGSTIFKASNVAGTNTITCDTDGLDTLSATSQFVRIKPANTVTGPATIAFDVQAAIALLSPTGAALANGEFIAAVPYILEVTSTDARILGSGATW